MGSVNHKVNGSPEAPAEPAQVEVPITEQIKLSGVHLNLVRTPDGSRILQIIDPMRARLIEIDLPPEISKALGQALLSTLDVAGPGEMPR